MIILQAINNYNPDVMKNYASIAMPVAFLAMHEEAAPEGTANLKVAVFRLFKCDAALCHFVH